MANVLSSRVIIVGVIIVGGEIYGAHVLEPSPDYITGQVVSPLSWHCQLPSALANAIAEPYGMQISHEMCYYHAATGPRPSRLYCTAVELKY